MRAKTIKQAVLCCLVSYGHEMHMSTLKRQVMARLPFPIHAKEINDSVEQLMQSHTVKQEISSSGTLVVKLQQECTLQSSLGSVSNARNV